MPASDFIINRGTGPNLPPIALNYAGTFGTGGYIMNLAQLAETNTSWQFESGAAPSMPNPATYFLFSVWLTAGDLPYGNGAGIVDLEMAPDPPTAYIPIDLGVSNTGASPYNGFTSSGEILAPYVPPAPSKEFNWISNPLSPAPAGNSLIHCLISVGADGTAETSFNGVPVSNNVTNMSPDAPLGGMWNIQNWVFNLGRIGVIFGDFWFTAPNSYASAHNPAVISKFIDSNGQPVFLGARGELPLGYPPALFFVPGPADGTARTLPTQLPIALRCVPCAPVLVCGPGQPRK